MKNVMPAEQASVDRLRKVPLFAGCDDETLQRIRELAAEFEVERGHVLTERGQPGTGLFIVEDGRVVVELPHKQIELGEGEFFGELALLDESAGHRARVAAAEHVRGLAIRRDDFEEMLRSHPEIAFEMLKALARRLGAATIP